MQRQLRKAPQEPTQSVTKCGNSAFAKTVVTLTSDVILVRKILERQTQNIAMKS